MKFISFKGYAIKAVIHFDIIGFKVSQSWLQKLFVIFCCGSLLHDLDF